MVRIGKCLLRSQLRRANMTQKQLADRLHMEPSQVSEYATDNRKMSFSTAVNIALVLGCSPTDLYQWIEVSPTERKRKRHEKE